MPNSSLYVDSSVKYFASYAFVIIPFSPMVKFTATVASIISITTVITNATNVIPLSFSLCNFSFLNFSRTFTFFSCLF